MALDQHDRESIHHTKLDLRVLNENGELAVIERINRTNGFLQGSGIDSVDRTYVYPNVPWIANALVHIKQARKLMQKIEPLRIAVNCNSFGTNRLSAEQTQRYLTIVKTSYAEKTEEANRFELQQAEIAKEFNNGNL